MNRTLCLQEQSSTMTNTWLLVTMERKTFYTAPVRPRQYAGGYCGSEPKK